MATLFPRQRDGRRRLDGMLLLVAGIFATYIVLNATMVWFSLEADPQLVSSSYYEDSQAYDQVLAAKRASARTGWEAQVEPDGERAAVVTVAGPDGAAVSGLQGTAQAYRPSDEALDQPLTWTEDPAEPGRYRATFDTPASGLWELKLDLKRGGERFYQTLRYVAP